MVEPIGGKYLDNIDPSTGEVYSYVPDSDENDVEQAYTAAATAFPAWSKMPVEQRSYALIKMADALEANLDRFARAECIDNGKPLTLMPAAIPEGEIDIIYPLGRWCADNATDFG